MTFLHASVIACALWVMANSVATMDKIFFVRKSGQNNQTLLVVTWSEEEESASGCEVFTDERLLQDVQKYSTGQPIRLISAEEMDDLLEGCAEIAMRRRKRQSNESPGNGGSRTIGRSYTSGSADNSYSVSNDEETAPWIRRNNNRNRYSSNRYNLTSDPKVNRTSNRDGQNTRMNGTTSDTTRQDRPRYPVNRLPISNGETGSGRVNSSVNGSHNDVETTTEPEVTTEPATTEVSNGWPIIWPGTKWCGAGDISKNYDDLGMHQDTDMCCRAHDLCNDTMAPKETKYNLTNKSLFTKLSCKCDQEFYDCLSRVNSVISNSIGNLYFNVLKRECYDKDYPFTGKCKRYRTLLKITCKEYERDTNAPKVYQWVPAKRYKKIPLPGPLSITLP